MLQSFARGATRAATLVAFISLLDTTGALAEPASNDGLEEITVTAQRVQENLQNVPIAVTALSTADLQARDITDLTQLTQHVPNLNFMSTTGASSSSAAFAFIRGIGQTNPFLENDPGVGIYVDGVYIGRTQGAVFDVLDLQRIEVLRGPQGTLYGRNTIGGAINLISNMPDDKLSFSGRVEGGNYSEINSHFRVNVPLTDRLFASLSLAELKHDGYVRPIINSSCPTCTTESLTNQNDFALRAALRWLASDQLTLDLVGDFSVKDNLPIGVRLLTYNVGLFSPPGAPPGLPNYDTVVANQNSLGRFGPTGPFFFPNFHSGHYASYFVNGQYNTSQSQYAGADHQQVWGTSITATWKGDGLTLKSITAYRAVHINDTNDGDGSPVALFTNSIDHINQDQESQEFQLSSSVGPLDWLAGLYGYKENAQETQDFALYSETNGLIPGAFIGLPCFTWNPADAPFWGCADNGMQYTNYAVANGAIYANGTMHFNEIFDIVAGVRYSYEHKTFFYTQVGQPAETSNESADWHSVIPRVVFEYHPTKQALFYASYSQGFKSGAFNNGNYVVAGGSRDVSPERVRSYELGAKTAWLEDRLIGNAALFYSHYTDQQLQVTEQNGNGLHAFVNAGASRIYGGELELKARPLKFVQLDASLGYTETKITEVAAGTVGVTNGAELPYSPKVTADIGAQVTAPLGSEADVDLRADWSYIGIQNGDAQNTQALVTPGRGLVNFRATYRPADTTAWEIYGFVNNAFDKLYRVATYSAFAAQFTVGFDGPPRTFGGGVNFHF
jgi:iron complex outermembrane receptor protein